jgi:hypothetical protein
MATSFSGGRSRNTRREPPTMGKQLANIITCGFLPSEGYMHNARNKRFIYFAFDFKMPTLK